MDNPKPDPPRRIAPRPFGRDVGPSLVVLAIWCLCAIRAHLGEWPEDLSSVYVAAHLWQSGQHALIYATPPLFFGGAADSWSPVMAEIGAGGERTFPYVYPPLWAALLGPVTAHTGVHAFLAVARIAQVVLMAASVILADSLFRPPAMAHLVWALVSVAMLATMVQPYTALWHSQPTILTTFLTLLAFERLRAGRSVAAGIALGFAAAIKLTPAAFAILFLFDRNYRALGVFLATGAALALASILTTGIELHRDFLDSVAQIRAAALLVPVNVSLGPALIAVASMAGLYPPIDHSQTSTILSPVPAGLSPTLTFVGLGISAACLLALRRLPQDRRLPLGIMLLGIVIPVFGPLGWLHYYMLPLLLLPGIFGLFRPATAILLAAVVVLPSLKPVFGMIDLLPWPSADFVWISLASWLCLMGALYRAARSTT